MNLEERKSTENCESTISSELFLDGKIQKETILSPLIISTPIISTLFWKEEDFGKINSLFFQH